MSVYDKDAFQQRVNYAAQCFMRGITHTRHFDTCFEMHDGDQVVAALVRRADKNPKLFAAIAGQWRGTFPAHWRETADKLAHIKTRDLPEAARAERERCRAEFAASMEARQ